MAMTITEALQNVDNVVANSRLLRQEHFALVESVKLIMERCRIADELEKEKSDGQSST